MSSLRRHVVVLLAVCSCLLESSASCKAQTVDDLRAADTSSPRDTLRSFIDSCNELYELIQEKNCFDRSDPEFRALSLRIRDCLDTSELPPYLREERAAEVSVAIKEILDRIQVPAWDEIPGPEEIEAAEGSERLLRWRMPETRLVIARATSGQEQGEYMFSPEVVRLAIRRYREMDYAESRTEGPQTSPGFYQWYISAPGHPALASLFSVLPDWLKMRSTLGVANWKWPGILMALAIAIVAMVHLYRIYRRTSERFAGKSPAMSVVVLVFPVFAMLVPVLFQQFADGFLAVRSTPIEVMQFASYAVALIAAVFVIFATANRVAGFLIAVRQSNNPGLDALIQISSKLIAVMVTLLLLTLGGQYLGIPVSTLLASAGIGGVAVALAAQDTLKNLFATLTLMADRPCSVGDLIKIEDFMGFVEEIGIRTAKLRLVDGTMLAIPNEQLAGQKVENLTRTHHLRHKGEIQIPLDTSSDKLHRAVEIIGEKLKNHEGMDPARPPRIFLEEFTPPAFRIVFRYYFCQKETGDDATRLLVKLYWRYKAFNDRLNFDILKAFEAEGISLVLVGREEDWRDNSASDSDES